MRASEVNYACSTKDIGLCVSYGCIPTVFIALSAAHPQDGIMGQIEFVHTDKVAKTSGVWVDGQYVGYLNELIWHNRLRLLPGEHEIVVRQAGYEDFNRKVTIEPGMILDVHPVMEKDSRFLYPDPKTSAEIRIDVWPNRAAVFLDDNFVGHVGEYNGVGRGMLVMPGKHTIKIALAGYKTFNTQVSLFPRQKFKLKTELVEGSINDADPLIRVDRPVPGPVRDDSSRMRTKGEVN